MTILSTDLRSLRRRGYNGKPPNRQLYALLMIFLVDRILHKQKAEREAAAAAEMEKANQITLASDGSAGGSPNIPISQCHSFILLEIEAINALKMCALQEQERFGERLGMSRKLP